MWITKICSITATIALTTYDEPAYNSIAFENWQFRHGTSAVPATHIIFTYVIVIMTNQIQRSPDVNAIRAFSLRLLPVYRYGVMISINWRSCLTYRSAFSCKCSGI